MKNITILIIVFLISNDIAAQSKYPTTKLTCKSLSNALFRVGGENKDNYWLIKGDEVIEKNWRDSIEMVSNIIWFDSCEFILKYKYTVNKNSIVPKEKIFYTIEKIVGNTFYLNIAYKGVEIKRELTKIEDR